MKQIYLVLTHTGTVLSKIIKNYTKDEFSHCSISLDINLEKMYSFGRLNPYTPLWAGFVHEYINAGTFKRFYKTKARIFELNVTDDQYEKIVNKIRYMKEHKNEYTFNILGLFAAGFQKKIGKENSFYCAEFVKYILEEAGVKTNLPKVVKPEHIKYMEGIRTIYNRILKKLSKS